MLVYFQKEAQCILEIVAGFVDAKAWISFCCKVYNYYNNVFMVKTDQYRMTLTLAMGMILLMLLTS